MRKGGDTFPGPGVGRRSTVGRSGAGALDEAFNSVLGGGDEDNVARGSAAKQKKGARNPGRGHKQTSGRGQTSLTSSATDDDFYSSLAQMAGESFDDPEDEEPSITEEDAKKMAHSLADMDDLESDLFGGSLGRKKTPSKSSPTTPSKQQPRDSRMSKDNNTSTPKKLEQSVRGGAPAATQGDVEKASSPAKTSQDSQSSRRPAQKPKKKFDFGEFDEDDPLAGLLSDEEDEPKPKKVSTKKSQMSKPSRDSPAEQETSGLTKETTDTGSPERPSTSRGRRQASQEAAPPPDSREETPSERGESATGDPPSSPRQSARRRLSSHPSEETISPPGSAEKRGESRGSEVASPPTPEKRSDRRSTSARQPKDEITFDSDEDLPGLDDSMNKPPSEAPDGAKESSPPPPRKKGGNGSKPEVNADIFGEDDGLAGLDDGKPSSKSTSERDKKSTSRFDQLLGKKEKEEEKKAVPRSLDDFMANIGTKSSTSGSADKKVTSPTSEESFQFGGYMPSAASSGPGRSRGLSRPDTAPGPGRRAVRFADELGLDSEESGRPATAPNERTPPRRGRRTEENLGGSFLDDSKRESGNSSEGEVRGKGQDNTKQSSRSAHKKPAPADKPKDQESGLSGSGGSDWLGLSGDDKGLDLNFSSFKSRSQSSSVPQKDEPSQKALPQQQEKPVTHSPRRLGRRGEQKGDDEFLRMLGITPDDTSQPKQPEPRENRSSLPWEGSQGGRRRGQRWRDQISGQGGPLDLSSPSQQGGPLDVGQEVSHSSSAEKETSRGGDGLNAQQPAQDLQPQQPALPWEQSKAQSRTPSEDQQRVPAQPATPSQLPAPQTQLSQQTPSHPPPPQGHLPQQTLQQPSPHVIQPVLPQAPPPQSYAHLQTPSQGIPAQAYVMQQPPPPQSQLPQQSPLQTYLVPSPYPTQGIVERLKLDQRSAEQEMAAELYERDKARLEGEVRRLVKRVQQAEEGRQRQEIDTSSRVADLEAQVRRLELERDHLSSTLDMSSQRHHDELSSLENSHKAHIKTLEESFQRRQERLKEETDLLITQHNEKLRALEVEKSDIQSSSNRKVSIVETAKNTEIDRLKDLHRRAMEQLRHEHQDEMQHLRRLKEQEVAAATSAHAHTKSLQSLMQQVLNSTKEVSDMRHQVEVTHRGGLEEREMAARARDEYLKQLQERSLRQQAENDEERARLQGLISKMEIHIREQTRQTEQERWKLAQQESRQKALQASLEEERRVTMDQLGAERADVQRAREDLLQEQRRVMTSLQEERRALAMERAQLSSTHREIVTREKHKTDNSMQAEANLEVTAAKIKEDAAGLVMREAQLKQEEEKLGREKRELERQRSAFEEERDRVGRLGLEVRKRSQEIEELCTEAARAREEGERALGLAEQIRSDSEMAREEAETNLMLLQEKEKQLGQDRLAIAQERRLLEMDKQAGRCWQCDNRGTALPRTAGTLSLDASVSRSITGPIVPPMSPASNAPDLLVDSLQLKRTLRKWSEDKEKDEEFLEQEAMFLDKLHRSHNTTKNRPLNESVAY